MDGVLILDKPAGMTSHDAVNRLRRITGERSIGHLGTLDPMATGVLPMLLGRMTRLAQFYLHCEKEYQGEIRLGYATDTYDATGEASGPPVAVNCQEQEAEIRAAAARFAGVIEQTPPPYSAKKISGVPAYKLARKNQTVELKPVRVEIKKLEITGLQGDLVSFRAEVASGTYLRSIAHDLGQQLGVGGHLASLRRTAVGEFGIEDAQKLEELEHIQVKPPPSVMSDNEYYVKRAASKSRAIDKGAADASSISDFERAWMVPQTSLLPAMPAVTVTREAEQLIRNGAAFHYYAEFPAPGAGAHLVRRLLLTDRYMPGVREHQRSAAEPLRVGAGAVASAPADIGLAVALGSPASLEPTPNFVAVFSSSLRLLCIARVLAGRLLQPKVVLC